MPWLVSALLGYSLIASTPDRAFPIAITTATSATSSVSPGLDFTSARWADEEDIETEGYEGPIMGRWWFWVVVGTVATGLVTTGIVITQKEEFVPDGELGTTRTDRDWTSF